MCIAIINAMLQLLSIYRYRFCKKIVALASRAIACLMHLVIKN